MGLTRKEIDAQDATMWRRWEQFRRAAVRVAEALGQVPTVDRVALFGSVAKPLWKEVPRFRRFRRAGVAVWHECKDVDLAVWMNDCRDLKQLQRARVRGLRALLEEDNIGVAHHEVELFILEPGTDRYLGRLCSFNRCPKGKPDCLVPGCGQDRLLQQDHAFVWYDDALEGALMLYDRHTLDPTTP